MNEVGCDGNGELSRAPRVLIASTGRLAAPVTEMGSGGKGTMLSEYKIEPLYKWQGQTHTGERCVPAPNTSRAQKLPQFSSL